MFSKIVNWFTGTTNKKENTMTATIVTVDNQFALVDRQGFIVQTYTRARDAKRGATRRGLVVA